MKNIAILLTALLISANAAAAINSDGQQAQNMDDVRSLGVIYINHKLATDSEADRTLREEAEARGEKYYHPVLFRLAGSRGVIAAGADIFR